MKGKYFLASIEVGLWPGVKQFETLYGQKMFTSRTTSRPARQPSQTPVERLLGILPWGELTKVMLTSGVKRPR